MTRVVVSVGTDHHPFERMLDWITACRDRLGLDVLVQRGATAERTGLDTIDYVGADELAALMRSADAVVCHGGPGTISLAQQCGHRPIVIARNPGLGEHVDDHQMRYVARLAADGIIDTADDLETLATLLAKERPRTPIADDAPGAAATQRFAEIMAQLTAGTLPRRRWRDRVLLRRER